MQGVTSRMDHSLECSDCKGYVHFGCTELPAYVLYSLKSSKRKFLCAKCVKIPAEFANRYSKPTLSIPQDSQVQSLQFQDISYTLKTVQDSITKLNFKEVVKTLVNQQSEQNSVIANLSKLPNSRTRLPHNSIN